MAVDYEKLDPPKKTESGVLAMIIRDIFVKNGFWEYFDVLVDRYVSENDVAAGRVKTIKRKTKSTIQANITATEMTFKTFIDILFNFLKVRSMSISVKLTFNSGKESLHTVIVGNSDIEKVKATEKAVAEAEKEHEEKVGKEVKNGEQPAKPNN